MSQGMVSKSMLKAWGKRMAAGEAQVVPVYVAGAWTLNIRRGNKRVLKIAVPTKKARA